MTARNTTPENVWDALRRLLNCNKQQLAAHLGVTRQTLQQWEKATEDGTPPTGNARARAAALLQAALRAASNADDLLRPEQHQPKKGPNQ